MMFLSVLGPLTADIDGEDVPVPAGMQRLLLAALLHRVRRPVSIDALAQALWPDETPSKPEKALQLYVHRLRKLLGDPGRILHGPAGYSLIASRPELDWQCFEDLLRTAREARHTGHWDTAAVRYAEALALWRSDPYEDVVGCHLLTPEIQRLSSLRVEARVEQAEVMVDSGRHAEAEPVISRLLAEFPRRESLYALLMLAFYRAGRVGDALEVYRRARLVLAEELGVDPGPKLTGVHRAILNRSPGLDGAATAPAAVVPAQLPAPIASLAGRQAEVAELTRPATGQGTDVRAIDGMAGVGKSTLAVYAAHRLLDRFPDGQLFADLRGSTPGVEPSSSSEVLGRLLEGLGVTGDRLPRDIEARAGLWRGMLRGKRMLVLLDNAVDSAQLRPLLPAEAGCLVLVTSRARLTDLDDARCLSLEVLPRAAAVELFTAVVGAGRLADSEALDEVLAACGGLPLALRLTAARFRDRPSWTLSQLAERLRRDRPEVLSSDRHGVARAFGVAYERLPDDQQRLFRRLSLHPGVDIGSGAASALAGLADAENGLEALVDMHLLQSPGFGRYRFHDLMRRYAESLTEGTDPDADRHAALRRLIGFYLRATAAAVAAAGLGPIIRPATLDLDAVVASAPRGAGCEYFSGPADTASALEWLNAERANLVAVACRAADLGLSIEVVALSWLLSRWLTAGAHSAEALTVQRLAAKAAADSGSVARAVAWYQLGNVYLATGERDKALSYYDEALVTFQETGDSRAEAVVLHALANVLDQADRLTESLEHRQRSLQLAAAARDDLGECRTRLGLALTLRRVGRLEPSREQCERALAIADDTGQLVYQASAHENLAYLDLEQGEPATAAERLTRSLDLYRQAGNRRGEYQSLNGLGRALCALGKVDEALERQRQAMDITRGIDDPNAKLEGHLWLGEALAAAGQPRDARRHMTTALELARRLAQPQDEQRAQQMLAKLALAGHGAGKVGVRAVSVPCQILRRWWPRQPSRKVIR